jgi:hypothetical protein
VTLQDSGAKRDTPVWKKSPRCRAANPSNTPPGDLPEAVGKLPGMVVQVTEIEQLMLELGHLVPGEATGGSGEIQAIHGGIDHGIAAAPIDRNFT